MASSSRLFLFTILILLSCSSIAIDLRVPLELYYETLCPASAIFIVDELSQIFENGLISIVDLDLVPYGNANVSSNGTITCQHGEDECLLNTIHACAINTWPDLHVHFDFINCVENLFLNDAHDVWKTCLPKRLNSKHVLECYKNGTGHQLDLENGKRTNALKPPHKYVPWVVVNGEPLLLKYNDFQTTVCKAYKGTNMPKICDELRLNNSKEKKLSNVVSYRSEISLPDAMKMEIVD